MFAHLMIRQPAKMLNKRKDSIHFCSMQQLPHLWCCLIIAANLVSFSRFVVVAHAINPGATRQQIITTATKELPAATTSMAGATYGKTNMFFYEYSYNVSDDDDDESVEGQRNKSPVMPKEVLYNHQLSESLTEMIPSNTFHNIEITNLTNIRNSNANTLTASSIKMELHKAKRYSTTTSILESLSLTTTTTITAATSYLDSNHTIAAAASAAAAGGGSEHPPSFLEDCLANRNSLAHVFTVALYSVVCVVGLFGNTLVIWVVFRFSKMQTVTNIYILNLAIADECFLIGIPFLLYTMRICSWKFGEYVCKAYMVSTSITQFTSSIFLLIMAADRYIAVCHPIESTKYRTLRIAKLVSMLAWITSAILMMPVILFASTVRQEDGINFSCNIDWPEVYKKHSGTTFILYTFLLGFAAPLCFILVFYYLVIRKLHTVQQKHKSKEKKRSHRKVTRLVLTVITVYILCWLPHWISQVSLINSFVGHRELTRVEILLFLLFGGLAYSNSAMNPILYAFLSDNFRKSFSKAFSCVTSQEVEAQLVNEHSVFTHKRAGSAINNKRRHSSQPKATQAIQNNSFLAPTVVHNSGGGSSSGGTSASTATTATDKSSNSNSKPKEEEVNGGVVVCATTMGGEKITLVVNHDSGGVVEHHREDEVVVVENQTSV